MMRVGGQCKFINIPGSEGNHYQSGGNKGKGDPNVGYFVIG